LFLDLTHWQQPTPVRLTINSTIDNNGGPVTLLGNTAGILQLDVAGHDLGDFTINGAYAPTYQTILKLGISDALTTTKNLTLTKGTFDLAGFDQTVNAIGGVASASLITNSGATASKLTIGNGGGSGTFSGVIADGTATISLEKTGGGTQTLAGPNTYSGDTTVSGGTLVQKQVNPSNELSTVSIADGAVLGLDFIGTDTVAKLFLGTPAVQVPAGTYNAAHPTYGNYFSLGGSLEVSSGPTPSSGFAAWITGSFAGDVVPADQQGPNDDPDGDGISNLVEYAIAGQDPTVPNAAVGTFSGLMLSFNKRQPLASDIIYYIEVSTDLGIEDAWQVVTPIVNDETTLSHTLPADQGKIFARLRITRP
jgi:autotransporter-associated beta strand protein